MNNLSLLEQILSSDSTEIENSQYESFTGETLNDYLKFLQETTEKNIDITVWAGENFVKEYQKERLKFKKVVTLKEYLIIRSS